MIIDYSDLIDNKQVISQDAYVVGRVEGVRYTSPNFSIEGIIVRCEKEASNILGGGSAKSRVLIRPDSFEFRDVLLLGNNLEDEKPNVKPDSDAFPQVENLLGMQVVTADNEILGTVKTIQLDVESWYLHTFSVKLDKEAHGKLGIKKLLFAKELTGLLAENIANVAPEQINLTLTMEEVKQTMQLAE